MKKVILISTILFLVSGTTFGQTLEKGNLLGIHVISLNLDPDLTYNQWKDFYFQNYIPVWDNTFQGDIKLFMGEIDRGDDKSGTNIILIYFFKSKDIRDKYFTQDGSVTEIYTTKMSEFNEAIAGDINKLGKSSAEYVSYNDVIIQ